MNFGIVITLLLVDFFLGLVAGWLAKCWLGNHSSPLAPTEPLSAEAGGSGSSSDDSQVCLDTLTDISDEVVGHADALKSFRDALEEGRGSEEINSVNAANRRLESQVAERVGCLSDVQHVQKNGLNELIKELDDYRGLVAGFCGKLESTPWDFSEAEAQRCFVECVQLLLVRQDGLVADLHSARREIAEHKARLERACNEARADVLTGLPNRRALEERLRDLDADDGSYVLVMFDVDRFKRVNDTHGHATGDAALTMLGKVLRTHRRPGDDLYRYGGEEFALVICNCSIKLATNAAERFRKRIEAARLQSEGRTLRLTVSVGVAARESGESAAEVARRADQALYAAKQSGRNCTCVYRGDEGPQPAQSRGELVKA